MIDLPSFARDASELLRMRIGRFPRILMRTAATGGEWLPDPVPSPADLLIKYDTIILLIHGFATDEAEAYRGYQTFLCALDTPWLSRAAGIFWPGDALDIRKRPRWNWLPKAKYASYFFQPARVESGAAQLADLLLKAITLRQRAGRYLPLKLHIIGHSMGCRLALEMLREIERGVFRDPEPKPISVELLALMAAAVPIYKVESKRPLSRALGFAKVARIYWSRRDRALRVAFRAGQAGESDQPRLPFSRSRRAVGFGGLKDQDRVKAFETKLDHGEYWPSPEMAREIGNELAALEPGVRPRHAGLREPGFATVEERRVGDRL